MRPPQARERAQGGSRQHSRVDGPGGGLPPCFRGAALESLKDEHHEFEWSVPEIQRAWDCLESWSDSTDWEFESAVWKNIPGAQLREVATALDEGRKDAWNQFLDP